MSKSMLRRNAARTRISPSNRAIARLMHSAARLAAALLSALDAGVDALDMRHLGSWMSGGAASRFTSTQRLIELCEQADAPGLPCPPNVGALGIGDVHEQAWIEAGERLETDNDAFGLVQKLEGREVLEIRIVVGVRG